MEGCTMANHELVNAARLQKMAMQEQRMELAIGQAALQSFFAKRARHDAELHTRMFGETPKAFALVERAE